jgi:hypothetical protein
VSGRIFLEGMARFSAFVRVYDAPYPQREIAAEGPDLMLELGTMIRSVCEPSLEVHHIGADGPVVRVGYSVSGQLEQPFRVSQPGTRVRADIESTYRYDTHGLLIEQWCQVEYHLDDAGARVAAVSS